MSQNLLPPLQGDRGGRGYIRVLPGAGNSVANFIMNITLDNVLLMGSHDRPGDPSVIRLGPEIA